MKCPKPYSIYLKWTIGFGSPCAWLSNLGGFIGLILTTRVEGLGLVWGIRIGFEVLGLGSLCRH